MPYGKTVIKLQITVTAQRHRSQYQWYSQKLLRTETKTPTSKRFIRKAKVTKKNTFLKICTHMTKYKTNKSRMK